MASQNHDEDFNNKVASEFSLKRNPVSVGDSCSGSLKSSQCTAKKLVEVKSDTTGVHPTLRRTEDNQLEVNVMPIDAPVVTEALKKEVSENPEQTSNLVPLHVEDKGPHWYHVVGDVVTKPFVPKNLPKVFESLPIHAQPYSKDDIEDTLNRQVREFVGDIGDENYDNLIEFCSPKHLETGLEMKMSTPIPSLNSYPMVVDNAPGVNLHINKKLELRKEMDKKKVYLHKLKYRRAKLVPPPENDAKPSTLPDGELLQPGKDLIFRVRVYRLHFYDLKKKRQTRHSLLSTDLILAGRQPLSALRERIVCVNDACTSVDVSGNPDDPPSTSAKELFPSGFLFINNVFYVDTRPGCVDYASEVRQWALARGLGEFPLRDMCAVTLHDIPLRLGHPEVYMHQGNCEHLFTFSEMRLLHATDPLRLSLYPYPTQIAHTKCLYCTTCGDYGTKWIVTDCEKVPFDPTYFCDKCLKLYLYKDGRKTCDFKAYKYTGNEINVLKPFK